jgi:hypothetical protein
MFSAASRPACGARHSLRFSLHLRFFFAYALGPTHFTIEEVNLMKKITMLMALGLASTAVLAQMQPSPMQPGPMQQGAEPQSSEPTQRTPDASGAGTSSDLHSGGTSGGTSGASGGTAQPDSTSGAPSSSSSGSSAGQPGMTSEGSGVSGTRADAPSAPTGGMGMPGAGGGEMSPTAQLQPKTVGDVTYICGGVGQEEHQAITRDAKNHDVMLTFATRKGEFLADVNVEIADARGKPVLQATCDGPVMLVDLPKGGKYRVRAEASGYTLTKTVNVPEHRRGRLASASVLSFPEHVATAPGSAEMQTGNGAGGAGAGSR